MKRTLMILAVLGLLATACPHDSDVVSHNLSQAADKFQVQRRVVFYNGITGEYMLVIEGLCALGNDDPPKQRTIVCKVGPDQYKKHFLGLSDNVTYFVEQVESAGVSKYHYEVIFKPETIVPDFTHS